MSKEVQTHVVVTAQAYGAFRHGQVVPVEKLPPGEYWKNYIGDGLRFATEDEIRKEFVTITRSKNTPGSVEIELANAKIAIRNKQATIDRLELEASRTRNDQAQAESPALLAGKDKDIKELKVALGEAQQKLAKSQAENIGLKQELAAASFAARSKPTGSDHAASTETATTAGSESATGGQSEIADAGTPGEAAQADGTPNAKPAGNGKGGKKQSQ